MAQSVCRYSQDIQADWVVLNVHSENGVRRWFPQTLLRSYFTASFINLMIQKVCSPLLIVNSKWNKITHFKQIIFPTDFSADSKDGFVQAIDLAHRLQAKMVLIPLIPSKCGIGPLSSTQSMRNEVEMGEISESERNDEGFRRAGEAWSSLARSKGVETEVQYLEPYGESYSDKTFSEKKYYKTYYNDQWLEKIAKKSEIQPTLVAVSARSPFLQFSLLQNFPCPVWVLKAEPTPVYEAEEETRGGRVIPIRNQKSDLSFEKEAIPTEMEGESRYTVTEEDIDEDLIQHSSKVERAAK
jgi:hypothetical protein